jgi:ribose transport system substrate-binding protein
MSRTRGFALAAAAVLLPAAAACGGGGPAPEPAAPSVAFVMDSGRLSFSQEMQAGFRAGVDWVGGVRVEVEGPGVVDGPKQVAAFRRARSTSPSGISVFTLTPDVFIDPLAEATRAGLPVIAIDNPLPEEAGVDLFVGNDNTELGRTLADAVIDRLPAGATGTVVIGTNAPGVPVLDDRVTGIRERFAARLPRARLLGPFDSKQEVSANKAAWRTLVRANPDALAFLGASDADGWNLAAIRQETHGRWRAGAFDLDPRALAAVKSGDLLLVSPEHFLKGAIAGAVQARRAKDGSELPKGWLYIPGLLVTPANVDAVAARQHTSAARAAALLPQVSVMMGDLPKHLRSPGAAG